MPRFPVELMPRSKPAAPARLRDLAGAVLREFVEGLDVGSQPVHLLLRHRHGGKALSRAAEPVKFLARVCSVSEMFHTDVGSRVLNAGLRPAEGRPKVGLLAAGRPKVGPRCVPQALELVKVRRSDGGIIMIEKEQKNGRFTIILVRRNDGGIIMIEKELKNGRFTIIFRNSRFRKRSLFLNRELRNMKVNRPFFCSVSRIFIPV